MLAYGRRIFFFLLTNLAVVALLGLVVRVLGIDQWLWRSGVHVNYVGMLVYAGIFGMAGSIISLLLSKTMARMSVRAQVIESPRNEAEAWLVQTVERLARDAGIGRPDVAIFPSEQPNAFATGARRDHALVAVSAGLLRSMNKSEIEAVLGHEIAHVANGDMVTLTLIQGVVNTFVIFLARVVGSIVDRAVFKSERGNGPGYFITVIVLEIAFGVLASMIVAWFSRQREFRADAGSAQYLGTPSPMVNALRRLGGVEPGELPKAMKAFGITDRAGIMALFSTHPPIEQRIAALQSRAQ